MCFLDVGDVEPVNCYSSSVAVDDTVNATDSGPSASMALTDNHNTHVAATDGEGYNIFDETDAGKLFEWQIDADCD